MKGNIILKFTIKNYFSNSISREILLLYKETVQLEKQHY